jgi:hypothetical protein
LTVLSRAVASIEIVPAAVTLPDPNVNDEICPSPTARRLNTLRQRGHGTAIFFEKDGSPVVARRHINPDGTLGGFVAPDVIVPPNVWIDRRALVLPGTVLAAGQRIGALEIVE